MHIGAQLFELFLVSDAETLLLVHDDQAEVFEGGLFGEDRMGADDDVDVARGKTLARFLRLLRGNEAAQTAHLEWKAGEAGGKVFEVLPRE